MEKSRYTEEPIAFVLEQADLGAGVDAVCRRRGISEATFYS